MGELPRHCELPGCEAPPAIGVVHPDGEDAYPLVWLCSAHHRQHEAASYMVLASWVNAAAETNGQRKPNRTGRRAIRRAKGDQ